MLTAILTDIHANREAFTACLADAERRRADRYVLLGDYVGYGADPVWVVERAMALVEKGAVALLGNHDEAVFANGARMNDFARAAIDWTRGQLDPAHVDFLCARPLTFEERGRLYVHASAANPEAWTYVLGRPQAELSFRASTAPITLCGHTHQPALYTISSVGKLNDFVPVTGVAIALTPPRRWLAVIGAVGQPRDRDPAACYAVFDDRTHMLTYIRIPYDIDSAARKILAAGLPPVLATRLASGT